MNVLWDILMVFGWTSLILLFLGVWTHLEARRQRRKEDHDPESKETSER